jgi:PAS domain S-box-containing protein
MADSSFRPRNRRTTLAAVIVLFVVCGIVNYFFGTVGLRPVATVCVILFTLYTGLVPGLLAAVVATTAYVWIGVDAPWASVASKNPLTTVVFLVTNLVGAVVASSLRARIAQTALLEAELAAGQRDRARLGELEAAQRKLEESERRYRTVGEFIPFGIWQTDRADNLVYISKSFQDMVGMPLEEIATHGWVDRVPREDSERFLDAWRRKEEAPGIWECEYHIRGVDGVLYTIHSRGVRLTDDRGEHDGWIGVSYDITSAKRALDRLSFLAEAGRLLSSSLDPETTLDRIAALVVPQLADWCAVDLLDDDGALKSVAIKHREPAMVERAKMLQQAYPPDRDAERGAYQVVKTGESLLIPEITDAMLVAGARDERHLALLREMGTHSAMLVPLNARHRRLGVVTFVDAESKRRFDESDLDFATILCARAALAYDNARLFAKEQKVAETFQAASLPTELPQVPGFRVSATYRAGRNESEVGGDWYDAFELPDGNLVVSIGDVAGKGLSAAVAMSAVRQILCAAAFEGASPADMLRRCNRVICNRGTGMVTAAIGSIAPESRTFTYASAGHPAVLYLDKVGDLHSLSTSGVPLGIIPEYTFTERSIALDETGLIVFYTDGLTEFNHDVDAGERALASAVRDNAGASVPNLADTIVRETLTGKPLDDIAVLAVELHPDSFDVLDIRVPAVSSSARVVRRGLRRLCLANDLSEDEMFRVLVAAGEAVSNAIEHAYATEHGTIRVQGSRKDGSLVIEVTDEGRWREGRRYEGGRGLELMRRLMDEVLVEKNPHGTAVRQSIALGNR